MVNATTSRLRQVFSEKAKLDLPVFVSFLTAGFPSPQDTVDVMLAMQVRSSDLDSLLLLPCSHSRAERTSSNSVSPSPIRSLMGRVRRSVALNASYAQL